MFRPQIGSLLEQEERFRAEISLGESVRIRHVFFGPFRVKYHKSQKLCIYGDKCRFRHVEAEEKAQQKVEEKWCERISCFIEGVCNNWFVSLKILIRESLFHVKRENWDQITPSKSQEAPGTTEKIGKGRVHREELSKNVNLMSVVFARQNSGKDHKRRPCTKKDARAE